MRKPEPADVEQAYRNHRKAMHDACYRILRNHHDAENATQNAVAKAMSSPPDELTKGWGPWLCAVAQNEARTYIRQEIKQRRTTSALAALPPDDDRDERARRREEALLLHDSATRMLTPAELDDLALYEDVKVRRLTLKEVAEKRGLPAPEVRSGRRRALRTVREALAAAYLAANPGTCDEPSRLAQAEENSPALRKKITKHVRQCGPCRRKRDNLAELFKKYWVVPGLGLPTAGLLAKLLTPKKTAVAAVVALAAMTLTVLVGDERPSPPDLVVVPPPSTVPPPTSLPPVLPSRPSSDQQAPPPAPEIAPEPQPEPASPAPPRPPAPENADDDHADDGARDDGPPPQGMYGWAEHERLVIDEYGRCDDQPETSDVVVRAQGEVRSMTVHLRGDGADIPFAMHQVSGSMWVGRIGPFDGDGRAGRYDVVVDAVWPDGTTTRKKIAELCVWRCGGRS